MSATVGIVVFPGSNCEHDVAEAVTRLGATARLIFHKETSLSDADAVVLPGGFAHGDYLRPGAIARFSPVMAAVERFAHEGGPVVGICNGFQVLCEAGLLPGALQKNRGLAFLCQQVELVTVSERSALTADVPAGTRLQVPINHFEGCYTARAEVLAAVEANGQVVVRYADNPNGSAHGIAGVSNEAGNVMGLMPHPEHAVDPVGGSVDGGKLFASIVAHAGAALPA